MKILQKTPLWVIYLLILAGIGFCLVALWRISSTFAFGGGDFIGYWSATSLIAHGENPYDFVRMAEFQNAIPTGLDATIMAWNPPLLFVFLLPLSWLPFVVAKFVWLIINIIIFLSASVIVAHLYMPEDNFNIRLWFLIFAVCLPQTISGIFMGQITFLVYFGLALGLVLLDRKQFFWAGVALILTLIKPHLVLLALVYILVFTARKKHYETWYGLAFAGLLCIAILFILRSAWVYDLIGQTKASPVNWFTPTVGGLMSYLGVSEMFRLMILFVLPLPVYLAWFHADANPKVIVAVLTLLTIPITFFGWSYDQVILLIPIAQIFAWVKLARSKYVGQVIFVSFVFAAFVLVAQRVFIKNDLYQLWFPFFIWVVYYFTWKQTFSKQ